jgi:hypothetical protein
MEHRGEADAGAKMLGMDREHRLNGNGRRVPVCHDNVRLQGDQLLRERPYPIAVAAAPTKVHPHVAAFGPAHVRKRMRERRDASLRRGIIFVKRHEHSDAPHALALLRPRHQRSRRCAPKPCDEVAPPHP